MKNKVCEQMYKTEHDYLIFRVWISSDKNYYVNTENLLSIKTLLNSVKHTLASHENMIDALNKIEQLPNIAAAEVLDKTGNGLLLYPDWH